MPDGPSRGQQEHSNKNDHRKRSSSLRVAATWIFRGDRRTPQVDCLETLHEFGADVDVADADGYAPAHAAAALGSAAAIAWLVGAGRVHVERLHASGATLAYVRRRRNLPRRG